MTVQERIARHSSGTVTEKAAGAVDAPVTVFKPSTGWDSLKLRQLWRYAG